MADVSAYNEALHVNVADVASVDVFNAELGMNMRENEASCMPPVLSHDVKFAANKTVAAIYRRLNIFCFMFVIVEDKLFVIYC